MTLDYWHIELLDKEGSPFVIVDILIFKVGFNSCSIGFDFSNKVTAFGFSSTFLSLKPQFDKNKSKTRYKKNLLTKVYT